MMMQPHKGYLIEKSVLMFIRLAQTGGLGATFLSGRYTSIVEITRFQLERFTASIKGLAEWFGLEVAWIVVDECLAPARELNRQIPPTLLSQM
jgi:hypothetical protein